MKQRPQPESSFYHDPERAFCWLEKVSTALLRRPPAQVVEALRGALHDENPFYRAAMLRLLLTLKTPLALPLFMRALYDSDLTVARLAYQGVMSLKPLPPRSLPPRDLTIAQHVDLRRWVAMDIAQFKPGDSKRYLRLFLLTDSDAYVRQLAAQGLGVIGDADVLPALLDAISDADAGVRLAVVRALGDIAELDALLPLLAQAQTANSPELRAAALMAVGAVGCNAIVARWVDLDTDSLASLDILQQDLAMLGQQVLPVLLRALTDPHAAVRRAAYHALLMVSFGRDEMLFLSRSTDGDQHAYFRWRWWN